MGESTSPRFDVLGTSGEGSTAAPGAGWVALLNADLEHRLQVVAVAMVVCWLSFLPVRSMAYAAFGVGVEDSVFAIGNVVLMASVVMSAVLGAVARWGGLSRGVLVYLALLYGVAESFLIEMITNCLPIPDFPFRAVPWTVVWILVMPVLLPLGSRKTLINGLAAATMTPFSFLAWHLLGKESPDLWQVVFWSFGVYMAAIAANVPVRLLEIQQMRVDKARSDLREMGSYKLVELLGRGGMGEVWRAEHQMLARPAAIKLIRQGEIASQTTDVTAARRRFEQEAQVTASLVSSHTVALYDFGVSGDGTFFYVMELLEGLDLSDLVRNFGALPPARVMHLLRQVAESLEEAHARGLVHRDVKPANIFVCRYGTQVDFVKVLDFGMVKRVQRDDDAVETHRTQQGLFGTPAFMAPEQVVQSRQVDARTDIYALGAVGYWLLTGRLVFERETAMEMAIAHSRDEPEPPSNHCQTPIPEALDRLILDCLAKSAADRPASAADFLARLASIPGARDWTQAEAGAWWATWAQSVDDIRLTPAMASDRSASDTWAFEAR